MSNSHERVVAELRRDISSETYSRIRRRWIAHSVAEDNRDIPGLMATLTDDCVYEMPQTGDAWHGHEGAERFYREMLAAFPDIHFALEHIVIGPQGVWEEARASGTHEADWLDYAASGQREAFSVSIFFPWDAGAGKFRGERILVFDLED